MSPDGCDMEYNICMKMVFLDIIWLQSQVEVVQSVSASALFDSIWALAVILNLI